MKRDLPMMLLVCLTAFVPRVAYPYETHGSWATKSVEFVISSKGFPAGSNPRKALANAMRAWNRTPLDFDISLTEGYVARHDPSTLENHKNEIFFAYCTPYEDKIETACGATAQTWWHYGGTGEITEVDIIFWKHTDWTPGMRPYTKLDSYNGPKHPLQTTAVHEFGHALGLAHESRRYNVMGLDAEHLQIRGELAIAYPGEDALEGAISLYGTDSDSDEDVGVTHWKYEDEYCPSTDNCYSNHTRVEIYDNSGSPIRTGAWLSEGTRRFGVEPGQRVKAEFTYENNGRTTQDVEVEFWISSTLLKDSGSTFVDSTTLTLTRDVPDLLQTTITIPSGMAAGDYYLVVVLDPNDRIDEYRKTNNSAWIPIEVLP